MYVRSDVQEKAEGSDFEIRTRARYFLAPQPLVSLLSLEDR